MVTLNYLNRNWINPPIKIWDHLNLNSAVPITTYLNLCERLTNCWIWLNLNWTQLTNGDIGRAVGFEELVDVRPDLGHPVDDLVEVVVPHPRADLGLHQLAAQVAAEEALHGLHVVGTQHPPETQRQTCKSFIYTLKYSYRKGRYLYILQFRINSSVISDLFSLFICLLFRRGM